MSRKGEVRRPWTDQELREMLRLLKRHNVTVVAEKIGRSRLSVQSQVYKIRKRGVQPTRTFNPWSLEDKSTLRRMWPDRTGQQVADALGRSVSSVNATAKSLSLKKSQEHLWSLSRRYHAYPPELKELIRLANKIQRTINERQNDSQPA